VIPGLLAGFPDLRTRHCVTGAMRSVYGFDGCDVSEELLLGAGEGLGFVYWHPLEGIPGFGGRANLGGFERLAGQRTGVAVRSFTSDDPEMAEGVLDEALAAGRPVMVRTDMGCLPYFDFGGRDYHFGGHMVVVCGREPAGGDYLVADREGIHEVPRPLLRAARNSAHRPHAPRNHWFEFDLSKFRQPDPREIYSAIGAQTGGMLSNRSAFLGCRGIRLASEAVPEWPLRLPGPGLREALANAAYQIGAEGGTGGGLFRYMFSLFLGEASGLTGLRALEGCAEGFHVAGDLWEDVASMLSEAGASADPAKGLGEAGRLLRKVAECEEAAWESLALATREVQE
jgi:hypothetical protein